MGKDNYTVVAFHRGELGPGCDASSMKPGQWAARDRLGTGRVLDFVITCPKCGVLMLIANEHSISAAGFVKPTLRCSNRAGCKWSTSAALLHGFEFDGKALGLAMVGRDKIEF